MQNWGLKYRGKCCMWSCHKRQQSSGWTGMSELRLYRLVSKCFHFFLLLVESRFFHAFIKHCTMQHIYYGTNWNVPRTPATCYIIPYYNLSIVSAVVESLLLRVSARTDSQDRPSHRLVVVNNISPVQQMHLSSCLSALTEHGVSHESHSGCSAWLFN